MGVWKELKKNKPLLIGVIFAIVAVLYIVYKSSNANKSTSGNTPPNQSTDPNALNSQLGGYIIMDEPVIGSPPVTVNVNGSTHRTRREDEDRRQDRGKSHHGIHQPKPPIPIDHVPPPRRPNPGPIAGQNFIKNGITYHTWAGNDGIVWGNTGPNTKQVMLKGPTRP